MKIFLSVLILLFFSIGIYGQSIQPAGPINICGSGTAALSVAGAPNGATFQWQLNGVDIAGATSINYTASVTGNYSVRITNAVPPIILPAVAVSITPPPIADFTFTGDNSCSGTAVNFTSLINNGTPPFTYLWDFGDGQTSISANPSHYFTSLGCGTGSFKVQLTVTDSKGCSATSTSKTITIIQAPDVQVTDPQNPGRPFNNCNNDPSIANPNYTITVNNSSPSASCITSYSVDWGDGTSGNDLSFPINHTYTTLGAFSLKVTGKGSNGCSYTKTYAVANQKNPDIGLGTFGPTEGCADLPVNVVLSLWTTNSPGTTYTLEFGDGASINLTHPLNAALTNDTLKHIYTTTSCPNLPVYSIKVTATNACRSKTFTGGDVVVKIKPQSDFIIEKSPSCVGKPVCFKNSSLSGFDVNCSVFGTTQWNFGDPQSGSNNSSTENSPCHVYSSTGIYTVTLTTINVCGPSTISKTVCITLPPSPSFKVTNPKGCVPLTTSIIDGTDIFNACEQPAYKWTVTYAADFCDSISSWSFAEGTTDSSHSPVFTFNKAGVYTIIQTLTNACGVFSVNRMVEVRAKPKVAINPIGAVCANGSFNPSASVNGCNGTSPLQYSWAFTNGTPSTSTTLIPGSISYASLGSQPIELSVINECGSTTATTAITVITPSVPNAGMDTIICQNITAIQLNATPADGTWSGSDLVKPNGIFTPSTTGVYTLVYSLNVGSCSTSDTVVITVAAGITNNIISANQAVCINTLAAPIIGQIASGGSGTPAYQWQISRDSLVWTDLPNETNLNYTPPLLDTTTFYRRVVNTTLCTGTQGSVSKPVKITINQNARALFTANPSIGCAPFNLSKAIIITSYPDRNDLYQWLANDVVIGSNTTGIFPGYTIGNAKDTVLIKLITTSRFGCKPDTIQQQFISASGVTARFTKDVSGGCEPFVVKFTNASSAITGVTFLWNFGNGVTSNAAQPETIVFNASPDHRDTVYKVSLKAFNGCDTTVWLDSINIKAGPKARFGIDTTFGCSPFMVRANNTSLGGPNTYYWNFGNGHSDTTYTTGILNYTYNSGNTVDTFSIQLIAANACKRDTQIINIRVAPNNLKPAINVNASDLYGCAPHVVVFNNGTTGATSFTWNFGDGTPNLITNNNQDVVHSFTDTGTFNTGIKITNGCSDTVVYRTVTVYPKPTAGFTTNAAIFCGGDTIRVKNSSVNATNFQWFWGDGTGSTNAEPTHIYTAPGKYTIYLQAERANSFGIVCYDTILRSITVLGKPNVAILSNINTINCAPFTLAVSAPGIINEKITWTIFDSTVRPNLIISTGTSAQYQFKNPGTFYVKLSSVNTAGCSDSTIIPFNVRGNPIASFVPGNLTVCTRDTTIAYLNTSTYNGADAIKYNWYVDGEPLSANGNFTHRFAVEPLAILPKVFTTTLIASNTVGCSDTAIASMQINPKTKAGFSINNLNSCVPFALAITNNSSYAGSYKWLVNGQLVSTDINPLINITRQLSLYSITLIAANVYGCKPDTFSLNFTSRIKPVAAFIVSDTLGCTGTLNVAINNATTNGNTYSWDWGDNTPVTGFTSPTHLYTTPGEYLISLVASDGFCKDTASQIVKVSIKPIAAFAENTVLACDTARVQFTNQAINGNSYLWTFGDGTTSTEINPSKSFVPSLNPYTVKLVAVGTFGCKDSVVKANLITAKVAPAADFFISPTPVITIPNYTFSFNNLTPNNSSYQYTWSLGDGIVSDTRNIINHNYIDTGSYPVRLIVFDKLTNCADTSLKIARISGNPGFMFIPNAICPNCMQENLRTFLPKGTGLKEYRLQIFTTWGELVFETSSLDSKGAPNQPWDAKYKGSIVQQDAYVWKIQAKFRNGSEWLGMKYPGENEYKKAGSITVVK